MPLENEKEFIVNIHLIENNFNHILYEFESEKPSYFRIALECHNALLRTMVEVLKGMSKSFVVKNKFSDKEKKHVFEIGNNPAVLIKKATIKGCNYAWRFSLPEEIPNYQINNINQSLEDSDYLIGFYDLLAMVQCDYFMKYYTQAETIEINDSELADLEWLHQEIRNKYEHFVPKTYGAPINDLLVKSQICIRICEQILVNPTNIYFISDDKIFKEFIDKIKQKINSSFIEKTA
jgi:hypothetical protein